MTTLLAGLGGALAIAGVVLFIVAVRGTFPRAEGAPPKPRRLLTGLAANQRRKRLQVRAAVAAAAAVATLLITGWPAACLAAVAAVFGLPALFSGRNTGNDRIAQLEGIEEWTRRLIGLLASGQGLEQMLERSAAVAPAVIAPQVGALAARLQSGMRTEFALRGFADDVNDPVADLVVAALLITAERRGSGLRQVLEGLAKTVAEEVAMSRSIEADRARPRRAARNMVIITTGFVTAGLLLARDYFSPYDDFVGQIVFLVAASIFAACYLWMYRLSQPEAPVRFLSATTLPGAAR